MLSLKASGQMNFASACLHELFEQQVERTPDRVAVSCEGQELTYAQLNRQANQLADYLRFHGVRPEVRVGVCLERSLELLTGILGVLKAGGAYVPLDPRQPTQRLAYMMAESQAEILVTQISLRGVLPEGHGPVIDLTADAATLARQNEGNRASGTNPINLAYVIFTSGSTGKPKAVAVTHANVSRLFAVTHAELCFTQADVWTLFHSYAFDFSVWELWGALLFGARLIVVPYFLSRSSESFYELLFSERVTVLNQTPTAFQELLGVDQAKDLSLALRIVILGGEALNPALLLEWSHLHPEVKLANMYGITETTVHVTLRELTQEDLQKQCSPIGAGLRDLQLYLLDEHVDPVPPGTAGEIHIAGEGVTRGYLNQPDTTAERFLADPFAKHPGVRMYKSGDQARSTFDGGLEFLGRLDNQIKIRGHRIELGEIEAVLRAYAEVRDAVVLVREVQPGQEALVAYLTIRGANFDEAGVRKYVSERLLDYMAPVAYIVLESLPLTVNGKLDQAALPEPEWARPDLVPAYVPPRTAVQELLCEIWSRVLGVEPVGIEDDFFELGGHSLLATELISQVREIFGADIDLRSLFDASTVLAFAEVIEQAHAEQPPSQNALLESIENLSPEQVGLRLDKHRNTNSF